MERPVRKIHISAVTVFPYQTKPLSICFAELTPTVSISASIKKSFAKVIYAQMSCPVLHYVHFSVIFVNPETDSETSSISYFGISM